MSKFSNDPTQRAEATTTPEGAKGWVDQAGSAQVLAGGHGLNVAPDASPEGVRAEARRQQDGGGKPSSAPTAARTFNELFEPPIRLFVDMSGGGYVVRDQHGRRYTLTPLTLTAAIRFMQAMEATRDARIDEQSVERATWAEAQHSVKVPDLPDNVRPLRLAR